MMRHFSFLAILAAAALTGCDTSRPADSIRVGSYNIRLSRGDVGTPNAWDERKADLVDFIKALSLDAFGLQEVCPDQAEYLRENLPEFEFVGDHRGADRKSDEASPVFYRKGRFEAEKRGTFWLSETPDVPASMSWGTSHTRVCSYLVLRDLTTGKRFCFANTHTDHKSAEARERGMMLVIERMKEFGAGAPIVFTGDHNCSYDDPPAQAVRRVLKDARDVSAVADPGPANTFHYWGDPQCMGRARDRIDYIYVSDGTRVLDFETHGDKRPGTDLYPSDHFPVTATIVLP